MKYMFASDIHGSAYYCSKMLEAYHKEQGDRLVLLGDLLYHGPRNDLPRDYAPKQVIAMLNQWKEHLYVIRGNCDAEVDQMVLQFPIMADYCIIMDGERTIYCSHGHVYNEENLPPMKREIFLSRAIPMYFVRIKRKIIQFLIRVRFPSPKREIFPLMLSWKTDCSVSGDLMEKL